jgi:hypothetical protein
MSSDDQSVSRRQFVKHSATATAALALAPLPGTGHASSTVGAPQPPTTYTLDIKFTGLCLFVLGAVTKKLHVLLPVTGGGGVPKHEIRLYSPGSPGWSTNGVLLPYGTNVDVKSAETVPYLGFRDGLENLSAHWPKSRVITRLLTGLIDSNRMVARVNSSGGQISSTSPWRGSWDRDDKAENLILAPSATWTTLVSIGDLFPLLADPLLTLPPINLVQGSNVHIEVRHAPADEQGPGADPNPPKPAYHSPSKHFHAYSQLFDKPINARLLWKDEVGAKAVGRDKGINPYTCMIGGGDG